MKFDGHEALTLTPSPEESHGLSPEDYDSIQIDQSEVSTPTGPPLARNSLIHEQILQGEQMRFELAKEEHFDLSEHLHMDMLAVSPSPPPPQLSPASSTAQSSPSGSSVNLAAANNPNGSAARKAAGAAAPAVDGYEFGRDLVVASASAAVDARDFAPELFEDTSALPHGLKIEPLPAKSRVETQIKVQMNMYPPPNERLLHLPADTISKPKLQLKHPFEVSPSTLLLDTVVVCDGDRNSRVNMCERCIKRERKRASRKKVRLPVEEAHWSADRQRRVIVFNCREVIEMGRIADVEIDGKMQQSLEIELPMRLACYCRHHREKTGFRVFFVIKDYSGRVLARGTSSPVMITDDHKAVSTGGPRPASTGGASCSASSSSEAEPNPKRQKRSDEFRAPPAASKPPSLTNISTTNVKQTHRSRGSVTSMSSSNGILSPPSASNYSGVSTAATSPIVSEKMLPQKSFDFSFGLDCEYTPKQTPQPRRESAALPTIHRIIPASGSIRGGIEVTLLGSNFIPGLVAKFGENCSISTQTWNATTIVAQLPPSPVPGPVVVSFEGIPVGDSQVFSYVDDTDRQLIELALQIVGMKMSGQLEDARDIARRIIGSSNIAGMRQLEQSVGSSGGNTNYRTSTIPLDELEALLVKMFEFMELFDTGDLPRWQLTNSEGQSALHLAACLGFDELCEFMLDHGAFIDALDKNGCSPLHFAALHNQEHVIDLLISRGAAAYKKTYTGATIMDLVDDDLRADLIGRYVITTSRFSSALSSQYPSDVSDDEDDDEETVDSSNEEALARAVAQGQTTISQNIADLFTGLKHNAVNSYQDFVDQPFWNKFIPERFTTTPPALAAAPPPSYEEIFPDGGASTSIDYSQAVVDDPKPVQRRRPARRQSAEEEVLQAWQDKRKQLNNDRMLFFFWLPVLIFTMVWISMKCVNYMNHADTNWLKESLTGLGKRVFNIPQQPPVTNN
ncbi:protein Spt23p [Trichomonascus vanleenenianus]|uniref:protein Spt23p n=1 Tax=Trichomonascus vanleenenianus TaxID=2268995 RepID=UPI003ECBAD9D